MYPWFSQPTHPFFSYAAAMPMTIDDAKLHLIETMVAQPDANNALLDEQLVKLRRLPCP
jgi:hypothetical protein